MHHSNAHIVINPIPNTPPHFQHSSLIICTISRAILEAFCYECLLLHSTGCIDILNGFKSFMVVFNLEKIRTCAMLDPMNTVDKDPLWCVQELAFPLGNTWEQYLPCFWSQLIRHSWRGLLELLHKLTRIMGWVCLRKGGGIF